MKGAKIHEDEPTKQDHLNWSYYEKIGNLLIMMKHFHVIRHPKDPNLDKKLFSILLGVKGIGGDTRLKTNLMNELLKNDFLDKDWNKLADKVNFFINLFFYYFLLIYFIFKFILLFYYF